MPSPVNDVVSGTTSVRAVPVVSTERAIRLTKPRRLTPIPSDVRKRPRLTRPQEKWRPPRRTKTPPKYVVKPRTMRPTTRRRRPTLPRAPLSGALRSLLSEEAPGPEASRSPRSRTLHLLRFLSGGIRLVQGRPRTRPDGAPPRCRPGPSAVGTRELHTGGSGGGSQQSRANGQSARPVRGPPVRPGFPSARADQAVPL